MGEKLFDRRGKWQQVNDQGLVLLPKTDAVLAQMKEITTLFDEQTAVWPARYAWAPDLPSATT